MSDLRGFYVVGTSPGGHCLHGPYSHTEAQRISAEHDWVPTVVVACTTDVGSPNRCNGGHA